MEIINGIDQDDICGDCADIDGATIDDSVVGGTTPATGVFTTLEATGQLHGALINNQIASKATFDILGLMLDPRFLNLLNEDPGAGTMIDVSGGGHDGTYEGSMTSGDRVKKGMGWALNLDGDNDYVDLLDDDHFSLGNGAEDEDVTWISVFEAVDSGLSRAIMSKWDGTTGDTKREWFIRIRDNRKLELYQCDESAGVSISRKADIAVSIGWHTCCITSPGDGGATAMNNVKIYVDGILISSTAYNNASYIAMENLTAKCLIAARQTSISITEYMNGDIALIGIDGYIWTSSDVWRFHQLCKGVYGL